MKKIVVKGYDVKEPGVEVELVLPVSYWDEWPILRDRCPEVAWLNAQNTEGGTLIRIGAFRTAAEVRRQIEILQEAIPFAVSLAAQYRQEFAALVGQAFNVHMPE